MSELTKIQEWVEENYRQTEKQPTIMEKKIIIEQHEFQAILIFKVSRINESIQYKQHSFRKDCEKLVASAVDLISETFRWMDDSNTTLSREGCYLKFVRRCSFNSINSLAQLKENVSVQGNHKSFHMMEGDQDSILEHVKSDYKKLGVLNEIISWTKYTVVLADGTHFSRVNFNDGSDYYHFSHVSEQQEDSHIVEKLPSTTAFIIAKYLQDTSLYRDLIEKGQLKGNESQIDMENQAHMHFLHLEAVLQILKDKRTPLKFSIDKYDPEKEHIDTDLFDEQVKMWQKFVNIPIESKNLEEDLEMDCEDPTLGPRKLKF